MLSGASILCFAPDPWDDIWRNRHQIMSLLAEHNQVLYVEPRPYARAVVRGLLQGEIPWAKLWAPRLTAVKPGLHVFHPPLYAPISGRPPLSTMTAALRGAILRRAMGRLGLEGPILWLFRPDMADIPGHYGERLLIYHIVDEYLGYADVDAARAEDIRRRERELIAKADLVLVTSRALLESKGGINPNTHWVPNGVDYERFIAAQAEGREPQALAGLPRPRIVYVGAINDKIDAALLLRVARAYPQWPLILVGPLRATTPEVCRGLEALRACPNVRFIGQVGVEEVPYWMAACDVGLLPYRQSAWTRHIHPLKLYEYLACGLPVVATAIPSLMDEADVLYIAGAGEEFVAAVGVALAEAQGAAGETLRAQRRARAACNTWRQRVEQISRLIYETAQAKGLDGLGWVEGGS